MKSRMMLSIAAAAAMLLPGGIVSIASAQDRDRDQLKTQQQLQEKDKSQAKEQLKEQEKVQERSREQEREKMMEREKQQQPGIGGGFPGSKGGMGGGRR